MKYLINSVDTYRVGTVAEVEQLHAELKDDPNFELVSFNYKTKQIKQKGEVIEEYCLVQAKKVFADEKWPEAQVNIIYEVE